VFSRYDSWCGNIVKSVTPISNYGSFCEVAELSFQGLELVAKRKKKGGKSEKNVLDHHDLRLAVFRASTRSDEHVVAFVSAPSPPSVHKHMELVSLRQSKCVFFFFNGDFCRRWGAA
jgi:hypothetical protein